MTITDFLKSVVAGGRHAPVRAAAPTRPPRLVALSGAGLSADSGYPTYRGTPTGDDGILAERLLTPKTLADNPGAFHRFCDDRRVMLGDLEPNPAHRMVARLAARYGERFTHVTQNTDDFVERAGYRGSVRVHGSLTAMRSIGNPELKEELGYRRYWDGPARLAHDRGFRFTCPDTGTCYRPDIVLTGEQSSLYHRMFLVMGALHPDDLLVVIGTSGSTVPVNRWLANADCRKVLNNLHASDRVDEAAFDVTLRMPAAEAAAAIEELAVKHLG
jgi:NAD-dependent deacetylase